jgi:hypothetical protein
MGRAAVPGTGTGDQAGTPSTGGRCAPQRPPGQQPPGLADPAAVPPPPHKLGELTTYELRDYRPSSNAPSRSPNGQIPCPRHGMPSQPGSAR